MSKQLLNNRYDIPFAIEVIGGNPNGDPDADNMPRCDSESGLGFMTAQCIKRRIRDYIQIVKAGKEGCEIYITRGEVLDAQVNAVWDTPEVKAVKDNIKKKEIARQKMCEKFWDIRAFGAVIATGKAAGESEKRNDQITGPVQIPFVKSVDPINIENCTITRMAVTKEDARSKEQTMGKKPFVHYGLYYGVMTISGAQAQKIGFTEEDLSILLEAFTNMYEVVRTDSKGLMSVRMLTAFKHESLYGNAPTYKLLDLVTIKKKEGVDAPRQFSDYEITIDYDNLPKGVEVIKVV